MLTRLDTFKKALTLVLLVLMSVVVLLSVIELAWIIVKDIITPPVLLLEIDELLEIFSIFLLVMIGIELLDTIKAYLNEEAMHAEVVILVGIIAVARKVIVLDVKELPSLTLVGIGFIILSLAAAYYLLKRIR